MSEGQPEEVETRQERRAKRLEKRKDKMAQHGRALGHLYKEATLKRADRLRAGKENRKQEEEKKTG